MYGRMGERHGTTYLGWRASNLLGSHGFIPPALQAQVERNWEFSVVRVRRESLSLEPRHENQFWGQR